VATAPSLSLAEASTSQLSASLPPGQIVYLGSIWNDPPGVMDLSVSLLAGAGTTPMTVSYRHLLGDYDGDLDVDLDDYNAFTANYGSTTEPMVDGNNNGVVDAADFTVWRDSLEVNAQLASPPPAASLALAATPGPASGFTAFCGVLLASLKRRRSRRR